jgi:glucosamine 6-phosphate synthetase-like amidotransferase/phosphosugar isomerase protein
MCSLFGLLDCDGALTAYERRAILRSLSIACEARGTDATGIAYFNSGNLTIRKAPVPARKLRFEVPKAARFIMGHTRMTTQGDAQHNYNNHPFEGHAGNSSFALAHNGVIWNDYALQKKLKLPKTKIETDSYVAVQLLERSGELSVGSVAEMCELLDGSFTITVLERNALYIARGNNPICVYHFPKFGVYVYASTEELLQKGLAKSVLNGANFEPVEVEQGEIVRIDGRGDVTRLLFENLNLLQGGWNYYSFLGDYECTPQKRNAHAEVVFEYARSLGVDERELELLLNAGFDAMDLEDLLYDDELREQCLSDIYCDYGYR